MLRDNPEWGEAVAKQICSDLQNKGKLSKQFSDELINLSVEFSEVFPTIAIKANRILLYRITPTGNHYIYIPHETLAEAAKTMNDKPIEWNHGRETQKTIGHYREAFFKDNKLYGTVEITDKEYIDWIKSLKAQNQIPNVSVTFKNNKKSLIELDNGILEICYEICFHGLSLCEKGVCDDKEGCGIRNFSEVNTMDLNTTLAEIEKYCSENNVTFDWYNKDGVYTGQDLTIEAAVWSTRFVNDLPDSSFAIVLPGGEKDDEGKTVPRGLRKLPFKDQNGKIDIPHLRNALARLPQVKLPSQYERFRASALTKLQNAARKVLPGYREREEREASKVNKMEDKDKECSDCDEEKIELSELAKKQNEIEETLKELSTKIEAVTALERSVTKVEEFLKKFEVKPEETKKELTPEQQLDQRFTEFEERISASITKAFAASQEEIVKAQALKFFAENGVELPDTMTLDQISQTKVKIPSNARKTLFTDDSGNRKTFSNYTEKEKELAFFDWFAAAFDGNRKPTDWEKAEWLAAQTDPTIKAMYPEGTKFR